MVHRRAVKGVRELIKSCLEDCLCVMVAAGVLIEHSTASAPEFGEAHRVANVMAVSRVAALALGFRIGSTRDQGRRLLLSPW